MRTNQTTKQLPFSARFSKQTVNKTNFISQLIKFYVPHTAPPGWMWVGCFLTSSLDTDSEAGRRTNQRPKSMKGKKAPGKPIRLSSPPWTFHVFCDDDTYTWPTLEPFVVDEGNSIQRSSARRGPDRSSRLGSTPRRRQLTARPVRTEIIKYSYGTSYQLKKFSNETAAFGGWNSTSRSRRSADSPRIGSQI